MNFSATNLIIACGLSAVGVALAAAGIYIGETDDAPGAGLLGILLMFVAFLAAVKIVRRSKG